MNFDLVFLFLQLYLAKIFFPMSVAQWLKLSKMVIDIHCTFSSGWILMRSIKTYSRAAVFLTRMLIGIFQFFSNDSAATEMTFVSW